MLCSLSREWKDNEERLDKHVEVVVISGKSQSGPSDTKKVSDQRALSSLNAMHTSGGP